MCLNLTSEPNSTLQAFHSDSASGESEISLNGQHNVGESLPWGEGLRYLLFLTRKRIEVNKDLKLQGGECIGRVYNRP